MTGQEAATLTKSFADAIDITGAISKLDGDTRWCGIVGERSKWKTD